MTCSKCDADIADNSKFCSQCGVPQRDISAPRRRYERTAENAARINQALKKPRERLQSLVLEICATDDDMGADTIIGVLRSAVPSVLQRLGVK